ncbi:MAG: hypothetical protein CSB06_00130 [Bacteroidia bacterium]|nr:MAG: hypothetical protein CSB06_00130 [Bacteroidia bacterium]
MKKRIYIILYFLSFWIKGGVELFAQDTIPIQSDYYKEAVNFYSKIWHNPALRFSYPFRKTHEASFSWFQEENTAYHVQEGKAKDVFCFDSHALVRKKKQLYYGSAGYRYLMREGQKWNTLADVARLQPYIIADTIGGKMYRENYSFSGGYARNHGRLRWGLYSSYESATTYRKTDPRPKNETYDLNVRVGGAVAISSRYVLGGSGDFAKYQQLQNLTIVRDVGSAALFFMRGLGVTEHHFSTVLNSHRHSSSMYKEKRYGGSIQLIPFSGNGFFGHFSYSQVDFRLLSTRNYEKISTFDKQLFDCSAGRSFLLYNKVHAVKLIASYHNVEGLEYNYTHADELLSISPKYYLKKYAAGLSISGEGWERPKLRSLWEATVEYRKNKKEYFGIADAPLNKEAYDCLYVSLTKNVQVPFRRSIFLCKLKAGCRYNYARKLKAGALAAPTALETLVVPVHDFLTKNYISALLLLRYDYRLTEKYRIYTSVVGSYRAYESIGHQKAYEAKLGLAF